jgi:starch synthase
MEILHVAAECFPVAKAGGLGDVVGALPKYQNKLGAISKVVMPMYRTSFLIQNEWHLVHEGGQFLGEQFFHYSVIREKSNHLGFDLYLIDINGLLDRENIYGYADDIERFLSFQIAVCDWLKSWNRLPDIVHCHDHHCGLIPFLFNYADAFHSRLKNIPTVFTIHNAQYQGNFDWGKSILLPAYDPWKWGMLDWHGQINPLAAAIKSSWHVTTVSPSYLQELRQQAAGLEKLFEVEQDKCSSILNGIDTDVWSPTKDPYLLFHFTSSSFEEGKMQNKVELCKNFQLDPTLPLFCFIGRLVGEKAADLLPAAFKHSIERHKGKMNVLLLGAGEKFIEDELHHLQHSHGDFFKCTIGYQEALSHAMYAGADFLLMPSRVEPCGLNQLYAMRFGTIPIVRRVGGLMDTVIDMGENGGYGICFNHASVEDISHAIDRAISLFYDHAAQFNHFRKLVMQFDFSWSKAAQSYLDLYKTLKK